MTLAAQQIGVIAAALIALAAAVAIVQNGLTVWFRRPRLDLSIELTPPDCRKARVRARDWSNETALAARRTSSGPAADETIDVYRLRMRVANRGMREAQDVAVFVSGLSRQETDGAFSPVEWFLPTNLGWTNFQWIIFPAIGPGTFRHCDLAHVVRQEAVEPLPADLPASGAPSSAESALVLATAGEPGLPCRALSPGTYRLRVAAAPFSGKAARKTLEISLSGEWSDDEREMLTRGVRVRPLE